MVLVFLIEALEEHIYMLALIYEYILFVGRLNCGGLDLFGFPR